MKRRRKQVSVDVPGQLPRQRAPRSVRLTDSLPLDWVGTQACDTWTPTLDGAFDLWPEGLDRGMFSSKQQEHIIEWQRGWYREGIRSLLGLLHAGDAVIKHASQVRQLGIRVLILDFLSGCTEPGLSWRDYIAQLPLRWADVVANREALAREIHRRKKVCI